MFEGSKIGKNNTNLVISVPILYHSKAVYDKITS
jgi:hypothetical protein